MNAPNAASGPIPEDVKPYFDGPYYEWWNAEKVIIAQALLVVLLHGIQAMHQKRQQAAECRGHSQQSVGRGARPSDIQRLGHIQGVSGESSSGTGTF